uniref:Putative ribonuclease H-like domain-containing protein n=1 Tax=Tanacetum cinerariifolium TaxID=118510 RepID=A0A6L2KN42_TANCI|nr:putative ribonuclease H-like domain-containing protein [Tanacetum cinerariifolium]
MRRVRKGFSGVEIPLFEGMLTAKEIAEEGIAEEQVHADDVVAAAVQETVAEDVANEAIPFTHTLLILPSPPSHDIPSTSQDSPFDLVAYLDSDYVGASLDRKSTTRGCQFLGCRLISWQCKKQTVVATSLTEVEYVAAASGYAQVMWIQN